MHACRRTNAYPPAPAPPKPRPALQLSTLRTMLKGAGTNPADAMGFIENHDTPRFLGSSGGDVAAYRNALAHMLLGEFIPIM